MSEVVKVYYIEGFMQIFWEGICCCINIGVNVCDWDVVSLVVDIELQFKFGFDLFVGYYIKYGGQFENLEVAKVWFGVVVLVVLVLIFVLFYFIFGKLKYVLMIFMAVFMVVVGGILGFWARGMLFSILVGVGFIVLFGVVVLNGIVFISYFNWLWYEEGYIDIWKVVIDGGLVWMCFVVMIVMVVVLGFLLMVFFIFNGVEV